MTSFNMLALLSDKRDRTVQNPGIMMIASSRTLRAGHTFRVMSRKPFTPVSDFRSTLLSRFMIENPGRQSISGSFNPTDNGEWSEQAYMGSSERFFQAIAANDKASVKAAIAGGIDIDRRDHVGRTPLQLAILSKSVDVACSLIDAGARMAYRLTDGRTALHLAAQLELPIVLEKLLARSRLNSERSKIREQEASCRGGYRPGHAEVGEFNNKNVIFGVSPSGGSPGIDKDKTHADEGFIPKDSGAAPDVFDVNAPDWYCEITPLLYAILASSPACVQMLCAAGANPTLTTTLAQDRTSYTKPLLQAINLSDDKMACQIAQTLFSAGAISSEADDNLYTAFHRAVDTGHPNIVSTFFRCDPSAKAVVSIPWIDEKLAIWPVVSALQHQAYGVLAVILVQGAKLVIDEDDFGRVREFRWVISKSRRVTSRYSKNCQGEARPSCSVRASIERTYAG